MTVAVGSDADHDALVGAVNELYERVERLEDENEQLRDENERLRDELDSVRDRAGRDRAELSSRVTELEETVESQDGSEESDSNPAERDETPTPDGPSPPKTGLEEIVRLPETVATDSLSSNQVRSRRVARDISEYAEYNREYGNYSLSSKRLRIILKSQSEDNTTPHHQTCKRVRSFLSRLGESEVTITEDRGGTKRVVFSESIVSRIDQQADHGVVQTDGTEVAVGT